MKKLLLFSLVIGFAISSIAQNNMISKKNQKRVRDGQEVTVEQTKFKPVYEQVKNVSEEVTRVYIGTAGHQRGVRREEARVVDYNYDLDVISVVSVLDPETYDDVDELGIMGIWYSADRGQTWEGPVILNDDLSQGPNYYLGGGLYNPVGNTSIDDMFGIGQGVLNLGGGDWNIKTYASRTLAGDFHTNYSFTGVGDDGYWNIFGLNQFGADMRFLNLIPGGPWGGYTSVSLQPILADFDGEEFDFDLDNVVEMNLYNGSDGVTSWIGMWVGMDAGCEIAWSNDGQIGYMWVVGVSDDDASGYQPVVFRTDDGGDNWEYNYLDFMDNDVQDILENYLIEASSGDYIPHVFESDGVVDVNGDLQMLVAMGSTSADVFTYPDSIGYHWVYPGDLFNVSVNEDGLSEILWVDSLRTENVDADVEGNYAGDGWQHRINAAKSEDETQVFFTWLDTRDNVTYEYNVKPDLFGWSRAFCDNPDVMESSICFTENSEFAEVSWFTCGADEAYLNDEGSFTVPHMQGVTPPEFYSNNSVSADPITLSYMTGIEFPILCYDNIGELTSNKIEVTQNMPNPFSGYTTIEVSTKSAAMVTVEVSNIMGQSVYVVDAGIINGTQKIELSAEDLEGGIYFYTVRVGSETITKKMIVE